jgi:hypothetical protein
MPGDALVRSYAWIMVRALFVAGHTDVIIDETNLDNEAIRFWACNVKCGTPRKGGGKYPALLPIDMIGDTRTESKRGSATFEDDLADELQGDIIAWKRHVVVFTTSLKKCEDRAKKLIDYNQRSTLIGYIRRLKWAHRFVENVNLEETGESYEYV